MWQIAPGKAGSGDSLSFRAGGRLCGNLPEEGLDWQAAPVFCLDAA
jgi:hypothetical protein